MPRPTPSPVALITGAGSGIGRATAVLLSKHGFKLALLGRREPPLRESATLAGAADTALILPADVADAGQVARAVDAAVAHFGRLDALINNAGHAPRLPIDQTTPEIIDEVYRVNAIGPACAIARAWPVFQRQRSGVIVNVSTIGTDDPFPGFFAYAASKAAVNLMARSCAIEGAAHNIRAFAVAPGAVETPMLRALFDEKTVPPSATIPPEDVAAVITDCILGRRDADNGRTIFLPSPQP